MHLSFGAFIEFRIGCGFRKGEVKLRNRSAWHETIHCSTALLGVGYEFRNIRWHHVWVGFQVFIRERQSKVVSHVLHAFHVRLFLLVSCVATCKGGAKSVAFDGAHEHDSWLAFVGGGLGVGCVEFEEIVSADISTEVNKIFITQMCNESL